MTATERAIVAHQLAGQALTEGQIAYRLGVGIYTVRRLLARDVSDYDEGDIW